MMYGTAYFPTIQDAELYYKPIYGGSTSKAVAMKIRRTEITIGTPDVNENQRAFIVRDTNNSRRFFIEQT
jgi:hypothetical protein